MANQGHIDALEQSSRLLRTTLSAEDSGLRATMLVPAMSLGGIPTSIVLDRHGILWACLHSHVVVKLTQLGEVTTMAGTKDQAGYKDGNLSEALFDFGFWLSGIAESANGDLIVSDPMNNVVRTLNMDVLTVSTFAGCGLKGSLDGPLSLAQFNLPSALAASPDGSVFVTDAGEGSIRRIAGDTVSTLWSPTTESILDGSGPIFPSGIAFTSRGRLVVSDSIGHTVMRVAQEDASVVIGKTRGFVDGHMDEALLYNPTGLALTSQGDLLICDAGNHSVRALLDGLVITLFAPKDIPSPSPASQTAGVELSALWPTALTLGYRGCVFVADIQGIVTLSGAAEFSVPLPADLIQADPFPSPSESLVALVNDSLLPLLDRLIASHPQILSDSLLTPFTNLLASECAFLAKKTNLLLQFCSLIMLQHMEEDYPDSTLAHIENTVNALFTFSSCFPSSPLFITNIYRLKDSYSLYPTLFGCKSKQ